MTTHIVLGQHLQLFSQKAVFWVERQALLIADLHLGKAGHFRKAGIPIPKRIHEDDLATLSQLVKITKAKQLIILGDLFHSFHNNEYDLFKAWLKTANAFETVLVKGNHDILQDELFAERMTVYQEVLRMDPFIFTHIPMLNENIPKGHYNLAGHIHPGFKMRIGPGQIINEPCFYFGSHAGILPAFGNFTGYVPLNQTHSGHFYIIANEEVVGQVIAN